MVLEKEDPDRAGGEWPELLLIDGGKGQLSAVCEVMEELGVVFIKWGQYLSTRDDFIPETYIREFTRLQNAVPPVPFEEVERILAEPLGHVPHQAFGLQHAHRPGGARTGQVVERGERRAVGQPRLGGQDVGSATATAMRHGMHRAHRTAQLRRDVGELLLGGGRTLAHCA